MLVSKEKFRDQDEIEAEIRLLNNMGTGLVKIASQVPDAQEVVAKINEVMQMQAASMLWVTGNIDERPSQHHLKLLTEMAKEANIPADQVIDLMDIYETLLEQIKEKRRLEKAG